MPKISIIVPVYNVEIYLERCLNSLIKQTLKDIEIIIVNDGSTDKSLEICNIFAQKDDRIKIINQKNGGLAIARNTGLEYVSGDYIGFIDSDDWVDLDFYEKLYKTAIKYGSDIAFADFIRKGKNKHKVRMGIKDTKVAVDINDKINACKNLTLGCVWNKIYRKSLIFDNQLRFPKGRFYEDGTFSIQAIYYANKVVSVPNTYYYYFVNPTSIVKSAKTQKKIDDKLICRLEILKFLEDKNIDLNENEFLTAVYKIQVFFLTLWVVKENLKLKKYYLFGSIPLITVYKNKNRLLGRILFIKFSIRSKQLSNKKIIELNKNYENGQNQTPFVLNSQETLEKLINSKKSICRFGDGEFDIIWGENINYQNFNKVLANRLKEILNSNSQNIFIAIPNIFSNLNVYTKEKQTFWRKFVVYNRDKIYKILNFSQTYYDSLVTRVYMYTKLPAKEIFNKFQQIWQDKNVVFVEGEGTRMEFNNDLFSNVKSVKRIICPAKNAFSKYNAILKCCEEFPKDYLFILALGPTATVLAFDLSQKGYRALDLGHLDVEYEWFLMKAKKKIPIKDKYVNETKTGKKITQIFNEEYTKEIYRNLNDEE